MFYRWYLIAKGIKFSLEVDMPSLKFVDFAI